VIRKRKKKKALWVDVFKPLPTEKFCKDIEREMYRKESKHWLWLKRRKREMCPVFAALFGRDKLVQEVHHLRGRLKTLLRDQRGWMAVSREGHEWIHNNIHKARLMGWLCEKGAWGKPYG
jgi:hypothetical protein